MDPTDAMRKYRDAKGRDRPNRTVGKAEFVRLLVAAGHHELQDARHAKIAAIFGSEVLVGDEWLSIEGE